MSDELATLMTVRNEPDPYILDFMEKAARVIDAHQAVLIQYHERISALEAALKGQSK